MRAAVVTEFNRPWSLKTLPDPEPAEGQVLIRIGASGLCGTDLHLHHGRMPVSLPLVAGHEPVGVIVGTGPGVTGLRAGDRVGVSWSQKGCGRCRHCQTGRAAHCAEAQTWAHMGGGNSELMLAWATGCTLIPKDLPDVEAAPVFCAGFTVMSGLRNAGPRPGERVAVLGMGGLGHLALQFSKALGLETFVVTGSESKKAEARRLGADEVLVASGGAHAGSLLAGAGGADIILGTTNSAAQATQALAGLRPEGRLVNMGVLDGPLQADSLFFLSNQVKLVGSRQNDRRDLVEALELVASGKAKPVVEVHPIDSINEVRDRLEAGKVRYRAVFTHPA